MLKILRNLLKTKPSHSSPSPSIPTVKPIGVTKTNTPATPAASPLRETTTHPSSTMTIPRFVQNQHGVEKPLAKELDRGGEGIVFHVQYTPNVLAKIYTGNRTDQERQKLELKIKEMSQVDSLRRHPRLAWPLDALYSENKTWCGYAMHMRHGISLRELCGAPRNFFDIAPNWHRQHLVRLCLDFLSTIKDLSNSKVLPVDFNPSNFLVDLEAVRIQFIDCDGFQFMGSNRVHLSEALLPEMAAPELLTSKSWSKSPVTHQCLYFSIAMMLYYILNLGNSPYSHRNGKGPLENLLSGNCALGKNSECRLPGGVTYTLWSHLIYDLKDLFIRSFREGHQNPSVRPTITEWETALLKYNHCIKSGHTEATIIPKSTKSKKFTR